MTRVGQWQSTALRSWTRTLMLLLLLKPTELPSIRWSDPRTVSSVSGGSGRSSSRCHGWAVEQSGPRDLLPRRLQPKAHENARSSPGSCRAMWTSWAPRADPYPNHSHRTYWKILYRTADPQTSQKTRGFEPWPNVAMGLRGSHRKKMKNYAESNVSDLVSLSFQKHFCTSEMIWAEGFLLWYKKVPISTVERFQPSKNAEFDPVISWSNVFFIQNSKPICM